MKGVIVMKGKLKRILSLALLAALLAGAVNLPLPGLSPAARAEGDFKIQYGILVEYTGPGGIVRIPRGVKTIGNKVFYGRNDITGVVIPNTVTAIGEKAFWSCFNLRGVAIPNTVKTIGKEAFYSCYHLKKVTLPKGVTEIGAGAFSRCPNLKKVTIPKGITRIDFGAFSNCTRLTSVTIPNTVDVIAAHAFDSCVILKKVTLPKGVTTIGSSAFYGCTSLTGITIPNTVDVIGEYAFKLCTNLKRVTIPKGVKRIDYGTFTECTSLTSIVIPSSVTLIDGCAFKGCTGLTSVVIPDSVTMLMVDAFDDCPNLRFVTLPSGVEAPDFVGSNPVTTVIPDNLLPPAIFLKVGQSMALPRFKGAKVTWSVDKPDVAAIVKNRTVRGLKGLDATLTLKVEQVAQGKALTLNGQPLKPGKEYEIVLTVFGKGNRMATKVAINGPRKLTLHPLGPAYGYPSTAKLDLVLTPASLPWVWKAFCFYISSNPGVAQVLSDGTIVAIKPGKAVITAYTPNMKTAKVTVTVKGWVTSLRLKGEDNKYVKRLTLEKGQDHQLIPEFNWDAALKAVRWTSSKPTLVYVDKYGKVSAEYFKGTAKITATALDGSGKKATVVVSVTE
jgi:hypothetical protein